MIENLYIEQLQLTEQSEFVNWPIKLPARWQWFNLNAPISSTAEEAAAHFLNQLKAMKEEQRQHSISLTNVLTRIVTSSFSELKRELKAETDASAAKVKYVEHTLI